MEYMLYVALFVFIAFDIYLVEKVLLELKKKNFVGNMFKSFNDKYEQRQIDKEAKELYEGSLEETEFIEKVDTLFNRSGIKNFFPFLTTELLVTLTLVLAVSLSIVVTIISGFWLYIVAAFAAVILTIIIILKVMARITFDKVDNQILGFIGVLQNFSRSNNGITNIFRKSIPYIANPINEYLKTFDADCQSSIPIAIAFKNLRKKIENNRLKKLLNNLEICSLRNENYLGVLDSSSVIFDNYFSEKKSWKKEVFRGRKDIMFMTGVGLFCFYELSGFCDNKNIIDVLRTTTFGNVLLGYFLVVLIYAIYKLFTLDKLNY